MLHREDSNRLIYKFNGGNGAVLCSNCYKIMYEGSNIPEDMMNAVKNGQQKEFGPVFCCDYCEKEWHFIFDDNNDNE